MIRSGQFNFVRRSHREKPVISTASLPDIIFMLLFFFMVSTQMRNFDPKVKISSAKASGIVLIDPVARKLEIWLGKSQLNEKNYLVQYRDDLISIDSLHFLLRDKLGEVGAETQSTISAVLRSDKDCEMRWVNLVKESLSKNGIKQLYIAAGARQN